MIDLCTVSFQTKDLLERQVRTLYANPDLDRNWSYHIADNGSTDSSTEFLEETFETTNFIDYLVLQDNKGYARACNELAALGKNEIIGLLNADVWFTPDDLIRIDQFFQEHPEAAIMGPKQRDENGYIRHAGIIGSHSAPKHRGWAEFDPDDHLYKDIIECITVSGSAYFIRRSVWDELTSCELYKMASPNAKGALIPTKHYFEETWCSYHAYSHGHKVLYNGLVSIGHTFHASHAVGSEADQQFEVSRSIFRAACDLHDIPHD